MTRANANLPKRFYSLWSIFVPGDYVSTSTNDKCKTQQRSHRPKQDLFPIPAVELLPAEAAIDPSEDAVSIDAAIAMRGTFAEDSLAMRAYFDALVELLTGAGRKH